jgi:hypothetical protein
LIHASPISLVKFAELGVIADRTNERGSKMRGLGHRQSAAPDQGSPKEI